MAKMKLHELREMILKVIITVAMVSISFIIFCRLYITNITIPNPVSFWLHKNLRIAIVKTKGLGEEATCMRMCNTLKDMGYCPVFLTCIQDHPWLLKIMPFDFAIYFSDSIEPNNNSFSFLVNHFPRPRTIDGNKYDAILSVVPENTTLTWVTSKKLPIIPFYQSTPKTKFIDTPKRKLFFSGAFWDKYRSTQLQQLYNSFENCGYFECYGYDESGKIKHYKFYKGYLPYNRYMQTLEQDGVSLVLHSDIHFATNTTTSRIFEAVAASNVVISDRLPFIVENFGDSVLYIDRNASPKQMFKQIDNHMKWILSHPKEAIEKARKSHQIFIEKFTLEKQLQNVIDYYKQHCQSSQ